MDSAELEKLCPEVQLLIMSHLEVESLYALVRASPQQLRLFQSAKELVLSRILRRTFHATVLHEAHAVIRASQLGSRPPPRDHVNAVIEYLGSYQNETSAHQTMPLTTCISLCRLHRMLSYFVNDYARHSLEALVDFRAAFLGTSGREVDVALDGPLSTIEETRLQRAFCRFELYGYLFGADMQRDVIINANEQAEILLATFLPWQNEELTSIREYLIRSLSKCFDRIEDDFVQQTLEDCSDLDGEYPTRWDREDEFFTDEAKSLDHKSNMEYMLSLGLLFLRRVFVATGDELKKLIVSNARGAEQFLTDALGKPFRNTTISQRLQVEARNGIKLKFEKDNPDDMNAGWIWASNYSICWEFARDHKRASRDMGHVFWDYARLEASGLYDYHAYEIRELGFDENARISQPSAQERLMGKQPPLRAWSSSEVYENDTINFESD